MDRDLPGKRNYYSIAEAVLIALLAAVPLLVTFPYRVNIFLSWEGAYRMSKGQLPFRDFGTPLGGMYWVIPAIFFKIFGTQMITLVKAQVFINILSGLAFRSILKSFKVQPGIRVAAVLLYCLSFSFFNFWPWYNHTVIVYELIAITFLFKGLLREVTRREAALNFILAAIFTCFSFLTKQDAGGMCLMLCLVFAGYYGLKEKNWRPLLIYVTSFAVILAAMILPFLHHGFGYWFNRGQAPHTARVSLMEIAVEFFASSQWIKFYLLLILVLAVIRFRSWKSIWTDRPEMLFLLLTLGILGEAAVFQVTSYTPPDNNIFFHAFAVAYILYSIDKLSVNSMKPARWLVTATLGILLCWSGNYWKYIQRILDRFVPQKEIAKVSPTGENIVNKSTYMINTQPVDTSDIPMSAWVYCGLKSFDKIYMPPATAAGIQRLMKMDLVKNHKDLRVLNMSELTPLEVEIPFQAERGTEYPLWYHLGVGIFNKQAELYESKIRRKEYDLVLFEYVPTLNNFYPFRVRDVLKQTYKMVDSFEAPRRGDTRGEVEIYVR